MHEPVLVREMIDMLLPKPGGIYVDATFGAGGYSRKILEAADCVVYAIDQDATTHPFFQQLSIDFPEKVKFTVSKFSNMKGVLGVLGITRVDGVVFDLGTSAMQLNDVERGFSFMENGSLNMRMDCASTGDAAAFINKAPEREIADIIYHYGGERYSKRVARAIVRERERKKIEKSLELAEIVRRVVPRSRVNPIDPATRTFQAIRIHVNNELEELEEGLIAASELLEDEGKLVVVSFHSLEDRIVKRKFNEFGEKGFKVINRKVIRPTEEEKKRNIRSRSAKLRAIIRGSK